MRFFYFLLTAPLIGFAALFSMSNLDKVVYRLFPIPYILEMPAFLLPLVTFVFGFVIGGFVMWNSDRRYRKGMRTERGRAQELEQEVNLIRKRLTVASNSAGSASSEEALAKQSVLGSFPTTAKMAKTGRGADAENGAAAGSTVRDFIERDVTFDKKTSEKG